MTRNASFCLLICWMMISCSTGSALKIEPNIEEFELDSATTDKIDQAAEEGEGAKAEYTYDEGENTITLRIKASSFDCGIEKGVFVAKVTELTATTMKWEFTDGDGTVTWTRLDQGTSGIVGVWETTDPPLFLVLSGDRTAQIFGRGEECEPERKRNHQNCLQTIAITDPISIDGDFSDWASAGIQASLTDETGDQSGDDLGADLKILQTAFSGNAVYVHVEFAAPPSTKFQRFSAPNDGVYRFTIQGYNGLSFQQFVYYDQSSETWAADAYGATEITFAVGDGGIEWRIDVSEYLGQGFEEIDLIMIEPMGYSTGDRLDEMDCAWFKLP